MADKPKIELITPPNPLRNKVSTGGAGAVTAETLARAESAISELAADYLTWVENDLAMLQEKFEALHSGVGDEKETLNQLFRISHDIKGQGGSFDYSLMTAIGNGLCRFIEKHESVGPQEREVIALHIDAMKLVIGNRMKGEGGAAGERLLGGLSQVIAKIAEG